MELKTLVFETAGKHNTDPTLQIAKERALALGIKLVRQYHHETEDAPQNEVHSEDL